MVWHKLIQVKPKKAFKLIHWTGHAICPDELIMNFRDIIYLLNSENWYSCTKMHVVNLTELIIKEGRT